MASHKTIRFAFREMSPEIILLYEILLYYACCRLNTYLVYLRFFDFSKFKRFNNLYILCVYILYDVRNSIVIAFVYYYTIVAHSYRLIYT